MVLTSIFRFERPGQKSPHREFNLPWISRFVEVVAVADPNVCSKLPTVRNDPHFSHKCVLFRFKTCTHDWKLSLISPPQQILKHVHIQPFSVLSIFTASSHWRFVGSRMGYMDNIRNVCFLKKAKILRIRPCLIFCNQSSKWKYFEPADLGFAICHSRSIKMPNIYERTEQRKKICPPLALVG